MGMADSGLPFLTSLSPLVVENDHGIGEALQFLTTFPAYRAARGQYWLWCGLGVVVFDLAPLSRGRK